MHYGPIACPCGHWAVRDVMRATLTGKVLHYKGAIVAPAFAGATVFLRNGLVKGRGLLLPERLGYANWYGFGGRAQKAVVRG